MADMLEPGVIDIAVEHEDKLTNRYKKRGAMVGYAEQLIKVESKKVMLSK
jgi:hypothetical protein